MDRRFILAIVLMMVVLIVPSLFFKPTPPRRPVGQSVGTTPPPPAPPSTINAPVERPAAQTPEAATAATEDTVTVTSPLYRYAFSTRGGRMLSASLLEYQSMRPDERGQTAQILHPQSQFLALALLSGRDTVRLSNWSLQPSSKAVSVSGPTDLTFTGGPDSTLSVELTYRFLPDDYRIGVTGTVRGLGASGATLLIGLGPGLRNTESDSVEHSRELGVATKTTRSELVRFSKLDPGVPMTLTGPFEWIAVKSKYFTTAILAFDSATSGRGRLGGSYLLSNDRQHRSPELADIWASMTVQSAGTFKYDLYVGPMEYSRLEAIGRDFDDINPTGWAWLRPIIRPIAIGARWLLVWFHDKLGLAYGLGLMLFGVLIRIVLWPLNQRAMRAGMQMQAIQPLLKEIQEKYKNEPQRLQQEMFKTYKDHKVNPFSGCWPLLLPWPILIALFFVFQNSIELRGASFLWLPDLSRPDPLFIIPIIMGVSMFAVTKVGQIGLPPNPQMKAMLYVMPAMMIFLFLGLASGLNLYYATVNIASIPQQWMVAKERLKNAPPTAPQRTPPPKKK